MAISLAFESAPSLLSMTMARSPAKIEFFFFIVDSLIIHRWIKNAIDEEKE